MRKRAKLIKYSAGLQKLALLNLNGAFGRKVGEDACRIEKSTPPEE
jgi:hypothetical protein